MSDTATSPATIEDLRKLTLKELDRIKALVEAPEKVLISPHELEPLLIQEVGFQQALSKLNELPLYLAQMMKMSAVQREQEQAVVRANDFLKKLGRLDKRDQIREVLDDHEHGMPTGLSELVVGKLNQVLLVECEKHFRYVLCVVA